MSIMALLAAALIVGAICKMLPEESKEEFEKRKTWRSYLNYLYVKKKR